MNTEVSLESIDTSYWKTKDKIWMAEREAQWPAIERVVGLNRRKADVNVIKQYFLRGKMPNWEKYKNWDDLYRHLDLDLFLWLHPSSEHDVLKSLYKTYMESNLIHERDVLRGYGELIDNEFLRAPLSWKSIEEYPYPFRGEKNIILFRVLFEDVEYAKNRVRNLIRGRQEYRNSMVTQIFEFLGYLHFLRMRLWLLQDPNSPLSINSLYQYDDVLEWCLTTMTINTENELHKSLKTSINLKEYQKALYCFYHFDIEKEGDTCRTRFIHKIRKILDECKFVPEFKQMWEDTKVGKIDVKKPWGR
ncbi:MAG: hypothetical protein IPK77_05230 [Cellvibrio sp.]|nr:hypothetical protein [Cellvibrio sp.]